MKKIILSAAVAAMAFSTSAVAADKGIDIDVTGQAVVYYETHSSNAAADKGQFDQANSEANAGIQLNLDSDLGNNFTFGSQLSYLTSLGLERDVVSGVKQTGNDTTDRTTELVLSKIFIAKKIKNTTVKLGRQELPKSLSPLAFTEGWQVFKNTFDAMLVVNTDLPKTTLVGAYVTSGTQSPPNGTSTFEIGTTADLKARLSGGNGNLNVEGATYMVTAQTKLIPMTTLTGSFYRMQSVGETAGSSTNADAIWVDAKISPKDAPLGLKVGLQAGKISADSNYGAVVVDDTKAFGAKVSGKAGALGFKAIYTSVNAPSVGNAAINVQSVGGVKSPLYSQMMYNQDMICMDSDTIVVGASYDMGDMGSVAANYGMSDVGVENTFNPAATAVDYNELDLVYKVKSGGVQYFAIAAIRDIDTGGTMITTKAASLTTPTTKDTVLRFWARYNF